MFPSFRFGKCMLFIRIEKTSNFLNPCFMFMSVNLNWKSLFRFRFTIFVVVAPLRSSTGSSLVFEFILFCVSFLFFLSEKKERIKRKARRKSNFLMKVCRIVPLSDKPLLLYRKHVVDFPLANILDVIHCCLLKSILYNRLICLCDPMWPFSIVPTIFLNAFHSVWIEQVL